MIYKAKFNLPHTTIPAIWRFHIVTKFYRVFPTFYDRLFSNCPRPLNNFSSNLKHKSILFTVIYNSKQWDKLYFITFAPRNLCFTKPK